MSNWPNVKRSLRNGDFNMIPIRLNDNLVNSFYFPGTILVAFIFFTSLGLTDLFLPKNNTESEFSINTFESSCDQFNINCIVTTISCFGGNDGKIDLSITAGVSPFRYNWSTGDTLAYLHNISSGTYSVTVTDDIGCTSSCMVTLLDPINLSINASVVSSYGGEDISCIGASDGQAVANASGGSGGFTYLWSNGQTGQTLINASAGVYSVTATDINGCTVNTTVEFHDPPNIVLNTTVTSDYNGAEISCAGDIDGNASVIATGGMRNYSYLWENGQSGQELSGVSAGTYAVTATDEYGCTEEGAVTISNPPTVDVSVNITSDYNGFDVSCSKAEDGEATASASGGVGGFTYLWSNGTTGSSITNVSPGTYLVTVLDANGCFAAASVDFQAPPALTFYVTSSDPTDCGVDDGIILINATGGVGTYEYSINGTIWQSSNAFTSLAPGTYQTYVRNTFGTCQTGPIAKVLAIPEAPTTDNITAINPTSSGSNDGGILVTASGNGMALNYSIDGTSWQSENLFEGLSEGTYNIYVKYQGFNCISTSEITLVAGGGVIGNNSGVSYCSDGQSGIQFVNTYYIPFPEDQVLASLKTIYPGGASCSSSNSVSTDPVISYNSIGIVETGTTIYYDHWEDDYEINIGFPIQASTEIWGDGDLSNGVAPGYPTDYFNAGDIIVLQDDVVSTTRSTVIDFDGGDKIASLGNLAFTRLAWTTGPGTYFAGALEVYPDLLWGTDFEIPVGENADVNDMFEYVGAIIMAAEDGTILSIDTDNDGSNDITTSIDEGESYLVNGNLSAGASISASSSVQVHLITGNLCETYETRWFTLTSSDKWSNSYFNPVATQAASGDSNDPTYIHFYNPNNTAITLEWETEGPVSQTSINVPARGVNWIAIPDGTGSHFYSSGGENFYAIATIDSDYEEYMHDWGFALLPESQLTSQITMVGFAPGENPFEPSGTNTSPVWITAGYRQGSSGSGSVMVCVDYDGDGGSQIDPNGMAYDASTTVNELGLAKLYDPDGDQTGMRVWVCDGSDAVLAGAWGQDPNNAVGYAKSEMDLGTGLPNGIPFAASNCVSLSKDYNSNGRYDECDEVMYTIQIRNSGALPLFTESLNILDTLSSFLNYIDSSTISIANGVVTNIPDDLIPPASTTFPLDEDGYHYNSVILPGDSVVIRFEAEIINLSGAQFIQNVAHVTNGYQEFEPDVTFPAEKPTGPLLEGIPEDITVACDNIPTAPVIGTDISTLNNCEETSAIPKNSWTIISVDSEDTASGEIALNAIDGDANTVWSSQWNGGNPGFPHEIQIDLGSVFNITGFSYIPRQSSSNGRISNYEFYISNDGSNWDEAVASGFWKDDKNEKKVVINLKSGRYIRLIANAEVSGNPWASIAELNVFRCINYVPFSVTFTETSTQTSNGSSTDDCYLITRSWEATDHCTTSSIYTQNITVEDNEAPSLLDIPADITVTASNIPEPPTLNCATPGNLALGMPTNQSSTANGSASLAVDGNTDGDFSNNSVTETLHEAQPWWEVDLGNVNAIDSIKIWNRTDCCSGALSNYYVLVSDFPFAASDLNTNLIDPNVSNYFESSNAGSPTSVNIKRTGRYIRIQLQNTNSLRIAEVEVIPSCVAASDNCDSEVDISFLETTSAVSCSYEITRTWTATDNCGNIATDEQVITVNSSLSLTADVISDYNGENLSCVSSSDGSAEVSVSGGMSPLNINWSDGQSGVVATGLSAGNYSVSVTDANGCTATENFTLVAPSEIFVVANITSDYNGADVSCYGSDDGSLFALASGGVGPYTYNWSDGQSGQSASGLVAGDYIVTATDANGCSALATITIQNPPQLFITANIASDYNGESISCNGASDGMVIASANIGVGNYLYLWSNGEIGDTISNVGVGTYTVTVSDENGCNGIASVTIEDPPAISLSLLSSTSPSTCEGNDGSIVISATGGNGTYKYKLGVGGLWQSSNVFNGLMANNYQVFVTNEEETCIEGPLKVTLNGPIPQSCPINVSANPLIVCNNDTTSFSVDPSADALGYIWSLPTGAVIISGEDTDSIAVDFSNVSPGNYDVCVITASNCGYSPNCCFSYVIQDCTENCGNGIDDDGDGLIDCADPDCGPVANINLPSTSCVNSIVIFEAANIDSLATYNWDFGSAASPSMATGSGPHNILFNTCGNMAINLEVTLNGCSANITESLVIEDNQQPLLSNVPSDVTVECNAVPSIANPTASDNCDTNVLIVFNEVRMNGTCDNSYVLNRSWTATDDCGNSTVVSQQITVEDNSAPVFTDIPEDLTVHCDSIPDFYFPTVNDNCDAFVTTSFNESQSPGGNPDEYLLTRNWTATDSCGNTTIESQIITVIDSIQVIIDPINATACVGGTVQFSIQPSGPDYSFNWNSDFGSFDNNGIENPILTTDVEGIYTIELTVLHVSGCSGTATTTVNVTQDILNASAGSNSPVCFGDTIELFGNGGTVFQWNGPNGFTSVNQIPVLINANQNMSGQYSLTITNDQGCTAIETVDVLVNPELSVSHSVIHADCDSLGKIDIVVNGGNGSYNFDWDDLNLPTEPQNRTGLNPGTYNLTISDGIGCESILENITINDDCLSCQADAGNLVIDNAMECFENGEATISATSLGNINAPPGFGIVYVLSEQPSNVVVSIENDADFTVNIAGNYTIHTLVFEMTTNLPDSIILNQTTISTIESWMIQGGGSFCGDIDLGGASAEVVELDVVVQLISVDSCNYSNGSVMLSPDSLNYSWSDGGSGATRNDLEKGFYQITATDDNGCTESLNIEIEGYCDCEMPELEMQVISSACEDSIGVITINVGGNLNDYEFAWSSTEGVLNTQGNEMSNLQAGIYEVTVTSLIIPNCYSVFTAVVGNSDGPEPDFVTVSTATCLENNGSIVFEPDTLTYIWLHDSLIAHERFDLLTGEYFVSVIDPQNPNCSNIISLEIGQSNPLSADLTINSQPNCEQSNGSVTFDIQGGSGNYTFNWSDNLVFDQPTRNDLSAGNYSCTITDKESPFCEIEYNFELYYEISGASIDIDPVFSVHCYGEADGNIDYVVTYDGNFKHPAQEIIHDNLGNVVLNGSLAPGDYCLSIMDANDCVSAVECFTITEADSLSVDYQVLNEACGGDGSIQVLVSGGTGNYIYDWGDLEEYEKQDRVNLEAGNYHLTVSDENGCTVEVENIIVETEFSDDCLTTEIFVDTIFVTEIDTFCVDTSELSGNIISIENICEDASGELVLFEFIDGLWCVTYLGIEVGTEQGCIVICDDLGFCDTTFMYITVIEQGSGGTPKPPIAVDDFENINPGASITIEVLENDTLNGSLEDFYFVTNPINGLANFNNDGSISYSIEEANCDSNEPIDTFDYAICNPVGCDTATVYILIDCEELIIYTGVSPNDDGVNDVFYIEGIENYPDNTVSVFNRWGNEVFHQKSYKNDWNGTYNSKALPDGTYFYILEDGVGKSYSGYIQILR